MCVCVCVCVCVVFTNKHMILNVVLVIKFTWDVNSFDQIVSLGWDSKVFSAAFMCNACCCYNYYELFLFLCVFRVSTAAVYMCV